MKNNFTELEEAVNQLNDPTATAIIGLLKDYNDGLSSYFAKREISREFLETFDVNLTMQAVVEKFNINDQNQMVVQQLALDLNTLARSTWYMETEDGRVLTGDDLYKRKAVYMASYKTTEPVFASDEDKQKAEVTGDYIEAVAYWGDGSDIPQAIGSEEVVVDIPGEENVSTVSEMVSLIQFHAMVLTPYLK